MMSYARLQRSQLNINKWGLFAKKLLIQDNKSNVFSMLNFPRRQPRQVNSRAMNNWVRLFRSYKRVKTVDLS